MTRPVITRHYSSLRMRGVWCLQPGPVCPGCPELPCFVWALPQCWAASPHWWLSNTQWPHQPDLATSEQIVSQQQMSHIPAKCKQSVLCLSKNCSVSAVRGNTGRSSEESWWVGREDSCYWRASHEHATVTAKECFWKAPWIISVSDLYKSTRLDVCVLCDFNLWQRRFQDVFGSTDDVGGSSINFILNIIIHIVMRFYLWSLGSDLS